MKRSLLLSSVQPVKFIRCASDVRPNSPRGFDFGHIPTDYVHLGDQRFASVFKDCVKVHVREFIKESDLFRLSKKGIVLMPFGWQKLTDKLDSYHYRRRNTVCVIPDELLMTSVTEDGQVAAVRLQRMFQKPDQSLQFYPETVTLDLDQMDQLILSREYITATVKVKLYGTVLQKARKLSERKE